MNNFVPERGKRRKGISPVPVFDTVPNNRLQVPDKFQLRAKARSIYILKAMIAGRWQDLYSFTLEPFLLADYERYNYWNSTSPDVRWTQQKVCTIPTKEGRVMAVDMEFKIHAQETTHTIQAKNQVEYVHLLHEYRLRALSSNEDWENH